MDTRLKVAAEVADALADGAPVVALESSLISHGLAFPRNVELGLDLEAIVRAEGAVPATVAVMAGRLRVGLAAGEIERIGSGGAVKVGRRDLATALVQDGLGGTTVSATLVAARLAGIRVFATGGIGGVHRGVETTLDVSADLEELARAPVAVVCAGAKNILDLARTLEVLETKGVPVIGFATEIFPAFTVRDSGLPLACYAADAAEAARILAAHWRLGLGTGVVVANPIPPEHALDGALAERAIAEAQAEALYRGIAGKAMTPFLLARIGELTGGDSYAANSALLEGNARVAAAIAVALAALG